MLDYQRPSKPGVLPRLSSYHHAGSARIAETHGAAGHLRPPESKKCGLRCTLAPRDLQVRRLDLSISTRQPRGTV
jgi:hypothetical protein